MKAWNIAWKDTVIRFRDRNALLVNLVAPLLLAAIIGSAFGGGGAESPIQDIPIILINDDDGDLGAAVVDVFMSEDLRDLLAPSRADDLPAALARVEAGEVRAVVYIPAGFTTAIRAVDGGAGTRLELYTDPTATLSPTIIKAIADQITIQLNTSAIGAAVTVDLLTVPAAQAALGPALANLEPVLTTALAAPATAGARVSLNRIAPDGDEGADFNPMAFFAPAMAIFFLSFAMIDGSRSILDEKLAGTLDRLVSTPTTSSQILLGKIGGTLLTGILQLVVLIVASRLLFDLSWGTSLPALALMVLAVVAAMSGLGILIAAFAQQPSQVQIVGTSIALVFGILGGNFLDASALPDWLQFFSRLTINRWAMEGFVDLTLRGLGVADILLEAAVLFTVAAVFFGLGVWQFQRRLAR